MAINNDVQDLDNFPGIVKRVTLDVSQVVPVGENGDEKMMMVASTSAYSDNEDRTAIQSIYTMGAKIGWTKSSGLKGLAGRFNITSSSNKLGISMDSTVSGTYVVGDKKYYEITLTHNDVTSITGEDVATDMQAKIRAITCDVADAGYQLAYTNSDVEFSGGKFYISSGSIANSYTDASKSSAKVAIAQSDDCAELLGFGLQVTSEEIAGQSVPETLITSDYTTDTTPLNIGLNTGIEAGDSFYISDGTNSDYCTAISVSDGAITVPTNGTNSFIGISNSYTVAGGAFVQIVKKQDPDVKPSGYCDDLDELFRYMNKSIINQIDFSS